MRIGIVGYGNVGSYLADQINSDEWENWELIWIWNRSYQKIIDAKKFRDNQILKYQNFTEFDEKYDEKLHKVDLIIEMTHPIVLKQNASIFLKYADLFVGSPTALADLEVEKIVRKAAIENNRRVYIGRGALPGAEDIRRMSDNGSLKALKITMTKEPSHLHVEGRLIAIRDQAKEQNKKIVLYEGPVRDLCPLAPKNVNTMATASFAAQNLGLDQVTGCLIADPDIGAFHEVKVEIFGPKQEDGRQFKITTVRMNPAALGQVTGKQTYVAFINSIKMAGKQREEPGMFHVV